LQCWHSRRCQQASRAIRLNWFQLTHHQQAVLDPVHVGLISYMCLTSEPLLEAELFDSFQQYGTTSAVDNRGYSLSLQTFKTGKNIFIQSVIPLWSVDHVSVPIRICDSTSRRYTDDDMVYMMRYELFRPIVIIIRWNQKCMDTPRWWPLNCKCAQ